MLQPNYEKFADEVKGKKIWVSVDETTDVMGRMIGNVVIGILSAEGAGKTYLLNSVHLEHTNHATMCTLFLDSIKLLGDSFDAKTQILLLVTDGVAYMLLFGKTIKDIYPKIIHVTCLDHALHRLCETIRLLYSDVNELISNGKKIFRKSPSRIQKFKTLAPGVPLPPRPIVTRWGKYYKFQTSASFSNI